MGDVRVQSEDCLDRKQTGLRQAGGGAQWGFDNEARINALVRLREECQHQC